MNFKDSDILLVKLSKLTADDISNDEKALEDKYVFAMMQNIEAFKEQLRSIRKKHSKTQVDVAKYLGITQAAYSGVESGSIIPRIDFIKKLSDFYGEDPSVFLDTVDFGYKGTTERIPVVFRGEIESLSFGDFCLKIQDLKRRACSPFNPDDIDVPLDEYIPDSKLYIESPTSTGIDYFFCVPDDAMEPTVLKGSFAACNFSSIKDLSLEDKLRITNNRIVLLSINNGPVMLRRVLFDGAIVTLTDSNHRYPSRSFPIKNNELIIKSVNDKIVGNSSSSDSVITADAITMYGIAKKVIVDI